MNELTIFSNPEFGEIRTIEINGEPWLVGKDVAVALGYSNPNEALQDHVDPEDKLNSKTLSSLGQRGGWIINESGLYSLVLSSKLPGAKKFRRWVTSEVLPSIRKNGGYIQTTPEMTPEEIMAKAILLANATIETQKAKINALEAETEYQKQVIADFEPMKRYIDVILSSPGTLTTTQIAADYNLSAKKLNKILSEQGIQRKVNNQWILYTKHMGKGYTKSKTIPIVRSDGRPDTKMETCWTQKGRILINDTLNRIGVYASMDKAMAT